MIEVNPSLTLDFVAFDLSYSGFTTSNLSKSSSPISGEIDTGSSNVSLIRQLSELNSLIVQLNLINSVLSSSCEMMVKSNMVSLDLSVCN